MHWYNLDGKPNHDLGMKEARAMPLVPSVTTLLGEVMAKNYGVTLWNNRNLIGATRRLPDDTPEDRLFEEARKPLEAAAGWGDIFHKGAEGYNMNQWVKPIEGETDIHRQAWCNYIDYYKENIMQVLWAEQTFAHVYRDGNIDYGFGGCIDLVYRDYDGKLVLADFKTKEKIPSSVYLEHKLQLAAYGMKVWDEIGTPNRCEIIFIDRNTGELKAKDAKVKNEHEEMFKCLNKFWWTKVRMSGNYEGLRKG